jgi:hypothetical protein
MTPLFAPLLAIVLNHFSRGIDGDAVSTVIEQHNTPAVIDSCAFEHATYKDNPARVGANGNLEVEYSTKLFKYVDIVVFGFGPEPDDAPVVAMIQRITAVDKTPIYMSTSQRPWIDGSAGYEAHIKWKDLPSATSYRNKISVFACAVLKIQYKSGHSWRDADMAELYHRTQFP